MATRRFVELQWLDAEGDPAWTADKDVDKAALPLVTMRGYLVRNTKTVVVLAMGFHEDSWVNVFRIPKGMIRGPIKTIK